MNNSDFPNAAEDLHDYLTHPQHWPDTGVILKKGDVVSVLHYNPVIDRYYHYVRKPNRLQGGRLGSLELCAELVKEGWVLQ